MVRSGLVTPYVSLCVSLTVHVNALHDPYSSLPQAALYEEGVGWGWGWGRGVMICSKFHIKFRFYCYPVMSMRASSLVE